MPLMRWLFLFASHVATGGVGCESYRIVSLPVKFFCHPTKVGRLLADLLQLAEQTLQTR